MEDYTYRLLTKQDMEEINGLFKAAFNSEPKDSFVLWKYFRNPAGDAMLAGAFYNGRLVGSGAMIPEKMNVFNREELVYKFTDLMTHPMHQKKGLSKNINKLLGEKTMKMHTPFSYTLCSKISTKSFVRNDWIFIDRAINFFKPWILLKMKTLLSNNAFTTIGFYSSIANHLEGYKFKTDTSRISVKKTSGYIKWRTSNPNFTYQLICSYDHNKKVNGYLIYSISTNNLLNIIDLESSNNDSSIEKKLLHCAEFIAVKKKHKGVLVFTIKNSPFYHFIKANNYLKNPLDKGPLKTILDFDVYIYDRSMTDITNPAIWDINGMSYDDI